MADLVLVHGWCCDRSAVAPLAHALSTARPGSPHAPHRVTTPELPGHGVVPPALEAATGEPARVDLVGYGKHIRRVAAEAGLTRPVVVGHSMGALVALAALAASSAEDSQPDSQPEYAEVRGAVLLDPAPVVNPRAKRFWTEAADQIAADADGHWRRQFADALFLPTDTVDRESITEGIAAAPITTAAAEARAIAAFDGAGALAAVRRPLLVIHAATAERGLREHLSDPSLLTVGQTVGAGHFHHLEVPDQVVPMIERWLRVTRL